MFSDRYRATDLEVFTPDERTRFGDTLDENVAWQLLYRLEPDLYARLIAGEHIHPDVLAWIPRVERCVEVAAGTGRLTKHLKCDELIAVEPCAQFRERLNGVDVRDGFFDAIPIDDGWADLVISCSAFKSDEAGLAEMERVSRAGGLIAIVWPDDVEWLRAHGFEYESFDGPMAIEFCSLEEAREIAGIFYPGTTVTSRIVAYEDVGMNPPRDVAYKRV